MTPDRWQQIEQLYHGALEREGRGRTAYVAEACGGDESLREEVESLLERDASAPDLLLNRPVFPAGELPSLTTSRQAPGTRLGPYELDTPLGAGGMGEVWKARDTRLGRIVAVKISKTEFSRRFEREARAVAALNHPHICALYDVGPNYFVMEYVEGKALGQLIPRKGLSLSQALNYAAQIADALAAAHAAGIVHRDLKPGNIMIAGPANGHAGRVKVVDFGLASVAAGNARDPFDPTITETGAGVIVGTLSYMSPEQALGHGVDARSDIFSFGAVLYEMLTGVRAFQGDSPASTLADVINKDPRPAGEIASGLPREVERLLGRCLRKDPARRWQNMADVKVALLDLKEDSDSGKLNAAPPPATRPRRRSPIWFAAGAAVLLLGAAAGLWLSRSAQSGPPQGAMWQQLTNFTDFAAQPALSPDGRLLAFIRGPGTFGTRGQVYVKLLPDGEPVQLTHDETLKMSPVFSLDGSRVVYNTMFPWNTWVVPVLGGEARMMLANASGLHWIDPGHILFSEIRPGSAVHMALVTAEDNRTGQRDVYVPPHERGMAHRSAISPDGKWVLAVEMDNSGWLPCRLVPFDGGSPGRRVGPQGGICTEVAWSPDGKWMYVNSDATGRFHIWRQKFDGGALEQVTSGPEEEEGLAIAADGRSLITSVGDEESEIWYHEGGQEHRVSSTGFAANPILTIDSTRVYYVLRKGENSSRLGFLAGELWTANVATGNNQEVLPGIIVTGFDISADGQRILYSTEKVGHKSELWLASADGRFPPRRLSANGDLYPRFGAAGEIYFVAVEGSSNYLYRMTEDGAGRRKVSPRSILALMRISPDGKWAFVWGATADEEMAAAFFMYPTDGGDPAKLCLHCNATWSPDTKSLWLSPRIMNEDAGKSFVIPFDHGLPPALVQTGADTLADIERIPGVVEIDHPTVAPGSNASVYAFGKLTIHRNLYRIPIH